MSTIASSRLKNKRRDRKRGICSATVSWHPADLVGRPSSSENATALSQHAAEGDTVGVSSRGAAGRLTIVEDEATLMRVWRSGLEVLRQASAVPLMDVLKGATEALQCALFDSEGLSLDADTWDWTFNQIIFCLAPIAEASSSGGGGSRRGRTGRDGGDPGLAEQRVLLCVTLASQTLLHHMPWLSENAPSLFQHLLLKLVRVESNIFRCVTACCHLVHRSLPRRTPTPCLSWLSCSPWRGVRER